MEGLSLAGSAGADSARRTRRAVLWVIAISTLVRLWFAAATELGNDEVYYWAYAAFPDWSHFDHPPMVGWIIQLFTLNLRLDSEVFIRLAAVVSATMSTWLMYVWRRVFWANPSSFP